jgi:putative membrane protein insertion efficiency factor
MASLCFRERKITSWIFVLPIIFYQRFLRGFHNRECIYVPTCSQYTIGAIDKYGPVKGWQFGVLRIRRCNGALYKGGDDPP